jgi:hypothetical protein
MSHGEWLLPGGRSEDEYVEIIEVAIPQQGLVAELCVTLLRSDSLGA